MAVNPWKKAVEEIAEWMKLNRAMLVPFVGAGVSRAANLPSWKGLADAVVETLYGFRLATEAELAAVRAQDPLAILTFCKAKIGDDAFRRQIVSALSTPSDLVVPEIARLCWRLNEAFVVTTNLDDLLERAAPTLDGVPAQSLTPLDSLGAALTQPGRRILHLHGVLPRYDSWVMAHEEYDRVVAPSSPTGATLQTLLLDRVLLFVGYACDDPDLNLFLDRFRSSFPRGSNQHYALLPELSPSRRREFLDSGIFPIEYVPSSTAHPETSQFLEEVMIAYDPQSAELWADRKTKQPKAKALSPPSELGAMAIGRRRDCLNDEFSFLFDQVAEYALAGASDLPPIIKQRRAETLEYLAGAWQVSTSPPLNAIDGREVMKELGRGGFGIVWLAEDAKTREKQALKVAHFQETSNFKFVERFKQGIRAMRRLTLHGVENTTKYLGHREVPLCVFMEYVDGGNLEDVIKNWSLSPETRLRIARDIARIVVNAHRIPVYHRDLKPSNVLIRCDAIGEPQPVLSDFDLAWFEGAISKTTTRIGDQAFASPEQLREAKAATQARAESDVYSLGMLVLFVVSKAMPPAGQWYNQNLRSEVLRIGAREFSWLHTAQHVADLVAQCANRAPNLRPTAEEVAGNSIGSTISRVVDALSWMYLWMRFAC